MKTPVLPSVQVEAELLDALDSVLTVGETRAAFVEAAVRAGVERRRTRATFISRGLRSREEARRTGEYVDAEVVLDDLRRKPSAARVRLTKPKG